ncbi:MAG: hypothetical protein AB1918_18945 [Pseudomonadota bacterium]
MSSLLLKRQHIPIASEKNAILPSPELFLSGGMGVGTADAEARPSAPKNAVATEPEELWVRGYPGSVIGKGKVDGSIPFGGTIFLLKYPDVAEARSEKTRAFPFPGKRWGSARENPSDLPWEPSSSLKQSPAHRKDGLMKRSKVL